VPRGYFTVVRRNSAFGPGPIRNYALLRQRFYCPAQRCRADDRTRKFTVAGNFTRTTCVKNKPPTREDALWKIAGAPLPSPIINAEDRVQALYPQRTRLSRISCE